MKLLEKEIQHVSNATQRLRYPSALPTHQDREQTKMTLGYDKTAAGPGGPHNEDRYCFRQEDRRYIAYHVAAATKYT